MRSQNTKTLTGGKVLATLIVFFGIVIGVNMTLTVLAIETLSGTEVSSAYSASLAYKNEIVAARQQDARHWNVVANAVRNAADEVNVRVEARNAEGQPLPGLRFNVSLQRPVDKRQDHAAALSEMGGGVYRAQLADIQPGQWDLLIEADTGAEPLFRSKSRILLD